MASTSPSAENNAAWSSPVPYVFGGQGRRSNTGVVEKVVERRQKRMIKNRESAARSRARKQVKSVHYHILFKNFHIDFDVPFNHRLTPWNSKPRLKISSN